MKIRRPRTSLVLVLCGITLLVSIYAGEKMGARVLTRTTDATALVPEVTTPSPAPTAAQQGPIVDWRRLQVVTVATDPGFPDPRVTRTPTPSPRPSPTHSPTPVPLATPPGPGTPSPNGAPPGSGTPLPSGGTLPPYAVPTPYAPGPPPGGG